jgi:hypothetical protein
VVATSFYIPFGSGLSLVLCRIPSSELISDHRLVLVPVVQVLVPDAPDLLK